MLNTEGVGMDEFVEYKGRPIVRQGDDIFYGDLSEKYYVYMMIMSDKKSPKSDENVPGTIMVQLLDSQTKKPEKQFAKKQPIKSAGTDSTKNKGRIVRASDILA